MTPCKHCGQPESAHHDFEREMPDQCKCSPEDWMPGEPINAICSEYVEGMFAYCKTCEHDEECHSKQPEKQGNEL